MTEGRRCEILLLDERRLEILVQPKLYAGELLDLVASHFSLKEKEYFGLAFLDDTRHYHWLQLDRRVLEQDLPKRTTSGTAGGGSRVAGGGGDLVLHFAVRFFVESITQLRDKQTIELFYLQARHLVYEGTLCVDSETVFELAAHILQATHGDFVNKGICKEHLKKLKIFPTQTLAEHPSLEYCEDRVADFQSKLQGQPRGISIVCYMSLVECLPSYGVHYYQVQDKQNSPWWLGISYKGVSQYDYNDKRAPRKLYPWRQLENLYFRDKKFSIEVHDPKRVVHALSSFNLYEDAIEEPFEDFDTLSDAISDPTTQVSVSRRTFGPTNVTVHAWFSATAQLTKSIWSMAISQHQFHMERKQIKAQAPTAAVRTMSEIAADLTKSSNSLSVSRSSLSSADIIEQQQNQSFQKLNKASMTSLVSSDSLQSEASLAAQKELHAALKARKDAMEKHLALKVQELRMLCIKEGELTGELPPETPLIPGQPLPQVRRRVGTSFQINTDKLTSSSEKNSEEDALQGLELEYELQSKITSAALRLVKDGCAAKSVRRQRKQSYQKSFHRLQEIEKKLMDYRRVSNVSLAPKTNGILMQQPSMNSLGQTDEDEEPDELIEDCEPNRMSNHHQRISSMPAVLRSEDRLHPPASSSSSSSSLTPPPAHMCHHNHQQRYPAQHHNHHRYEHEQKLVNRMPHLHRSTSTPPASPMSSQNSENSRTSSPSPHRPPVGLGYMPNSVYTTRTSYRAKNYPTFSSRNVGEDAAEEEEVEYPPQALHVSVTDDDIVRKKKNGGPQYLRYGSLERNSHRRMKANSRPNREFQASDNKHWYETSLDALSNGDHKAEDAAEDVTDSVFNPYREVSKPYEMSDYYKYSSKIKSRNNSSSASDSGGATAAAAAPASPLSPSTYKMYSPVYQTTNSKVASPFKLQTGVAYSTSAAVVYSKKHQPMTCEPVERKERSNRRKFSNLSSPSAAQCEHSAASVADNFSEEMLAWYDDQDSKKATLV